MADLHNPLRRFGLAIGLIFIFVRFTNLHELLAEQLGFNTYILFVLGPPPLLAVFLTGGLRRCMQVPPVKYWVGFMLCMIMAVPFSLFKMGSLNLVFTYLRTEFITLFIIVGLVLTWNEAWRVLQVLACAAVVDVVIGNLFQHTQAERLELTVGSMSNANDYGAMLIAMLPFVLMVIFTPKRAFLLRAVCITTVVYGLYLILATGSRGALVALIFSAIFALKRMSTPLRLVSAVLILVVSVGSMMSLPATVTLRLRTWFSASAEEVNEAAGSAESRSILLRKSLWFTLTHPVFGVGPGMFSDYEDGGARLEGRRGNWHQTHNSYTQVSSECGIPAALFFIAAIVATVRWLNRINRRLQNEQPGFLTRRMKIAVFCVTLSVVGFAAAIFFLSLAYRFYMPALTGVAIALSRAIEYELDIGKMQMQQAIQGRFA